MILDTENVTTRNSFRLSDSASIAAVLVEQHGWCATSPTPVVTVGPLDYRIAQLEVAVAAQARELHEIRLALKGIVAALSKFDGDGR